MKLYKLENSINGGCDTYDSCIVAAHTEDEARLIHPSTYVENWNLKDNDSWCDSDLVTVECIGKAIKGIKKGIILSSFNAG